MFELEWIFLRPRAARIRFIGLLLLFALGLPGLAAGQNEPTGWSEAINLSQSAAAQTPPVVLDAAGQAHILWWDQNAGFMLAAGDGQNWAAPEAAVLPFGPPSPRVAPHYRPRLGAGANGTVHAVWSDESRALLYSRAPAAALGNPAAWSAPAQLAEAAEGAAFVVDAAGRLHLAYLRPLESELAPAGVYYRQSRDGGATWSDPQNLYASSYLRALTPESAHLSLAVGRGGELLLAWDNRPLERVYMARSTDGGLGWSDPEEVDRRLEGDNVGSSGPARLSLHATQDGMHRTWQAGHQGATCSQYHQLSADGGATWGERRPLFPALQGCSAGLHFIAGEDGRTLLMLETESAVYFSAWNGQGWGELRPEPALSEFIAPETFRLVDFDCLQPALTGPAGAQVLLVVGCDAGEGQEVWLRWIDFASLAAALAPGDEPSWEYPTLVAPISAEANDLKLAADGDGFLHAAWIQAANAGVEVSAIQYSRWDGGQWLPPAAVLSAPGVNTAVQFDLAVDATGRLSAAWNDARPGRLFFSQAATSRASSAGDWSTPAELPLEGLSAASPAVAVSPAGVHLVFAVPLNEGRGIYLTFSSDDGLTWQSPVRVVDAATLGWEMVDEPRLAAGADGALHVTWTRYTLPPERQALAVYYSRSADGGRSWSQPEEVAAAGWSALLAPAGGGLHRLWLDAEGALFHQGSADGGQSWSAPAQVTAAAGAHAHPAVVADSAGRLHLLWAEPEASGLNYSRWDGTTWTQGAAFDTRLTALNGLAAAAGADDQLSLIAAGPSAELGSDNGRPVVYFSQLALDLPEALATPPPTPPAVTAEPSPAAEANTVATAEPSPTAAFPLQNESNEPFDLAPGPTGSSLGGLLGIVPAALVVIVVVFLATRIARGDRR
ncbi:MAG: exo-alpha-sialidase [Candidatus Promineifilaceae bacterium]